MCVEVFAKNTQNKCVKRLDNPLVKPQENWVKKNNLTFRFTLSQMELFISYGKTKIIYDTGS